MSVHKVIRSGLPITDWTLLSPADDSITESECVDVSGWPIPLAGVCVHCPVPDRRWVRPRIAPVAWAQETPPAEPPAAPASPPEESLMMHIVKSAGIVFGPLLLFLSIGLVALVVLLALDLRMDVAIPPGFVEEFTDTVNKRKFKEAFDMARNDPSFLGQVLTAGMSRLQYGIEDAREAALQHGGEHQGRARSR